MRFGQLAKEFWRNSEEEIFAPSYLQLDSDRGIQDRIQRSPSTVSSLRAGKGKCKTMKAPVIKVKKNRDKL
jgi:hypothetical protein